MRHRLSAATATAICTILGLAPNLAYAHGGLSLGDTHGNALLWIYPIVLGGIVGAIVLRIYRRSTRPAGQRQIVGRLADLETALSSNLTTLRNAEEYPAECGLSAEETQTRLDAVAKIRRLIEDEKLNLASIQENPQPAET